MPNFKVESAMGRTMGVFASRDLADEYCADYARNVEARKGITDATFGWQITETDEPVTHAPKMTRDEARNAIGRLLSGE
jgi:hypothetical protein